ncbi:MAG: hypothetical protein IIZ09_09320 [Ruminococcus sp.]|nr:hypothetical protein [Ruminococcus sp.]
MKKLVKYGFFDSVGGDRKYSADDIGNYFVKLISDGVFATPATALQVQANSGMTVQVTAGWGFIKCHWLNNNAPLLLTLDAADPILSRTDRIVMRLDTAGRLCEIAVKKGTSGSTSAPTLTRVAGGIWELSLAQIAVAPGVAEITQAAITDERADTSVCGYVTGLIDQIDTTNLFAQFNSAFTTWFDSVKDEVKSTTIMIDLHSRYIASAGDTNIPINLSAYNSALDIINVYINGMRLQAGVDYTSDSYYVYLSQAVTVDDTPVDIEVLKSTDTSAAESIAAFVAALESRVQALENRMGGMTLRKMTQAAYDALTTKDSSTIYYVYDGNGKITQYMGDVELSNGKSTIGTPTAIVNGIATGVSGTPVYSDTFLRED